MGKSKKTFFKKPEPNKGRFVNSKFKKEVNDNALSPAFNFEHLPPKSAYSLSNCEQREKVALIQTLEKLSRMSWAEIQTAPRHGLGYEMISLSKLGIGSGGIPEDVKLLVFRFSSKKGRMVGYRNGRIFYICLLDRNHDLFLKILLWTFY